MNKNDGPFGPRIKRALGILNVTRKNPTARVSITLAYDPNSNYSVEVNGIPDPATFGTLADALDWVSRRGKSFVQDKEEELRELRAAMQRIPDDDP